MQPKITEAVTILLISFVSFSPFYRQTRTGKEVGNIAQGEFSQVLYLLCESH